MCRALIAISMQDSITPPRGAELRRHSLIRTTLGRRDRLLEQLGQRSFARCTIERIGCLPEPLTLKQACNEAGHSVRRHRQ